MHNTFDNSVTDSIVRNALGWRWRTKALGQWLISIHILLWILSFLASFSFITFVTARTTQLCVTYKIWSYPSTLVGFQSTVICFLQTLHDPEIRVFLSLTTFSQSVKKIRNIVRYFFIEIRHVYLFTNTHTQAVLTLSKFWKTNRGSSKIPRKP